MLGHIIGGARWLDAWLHGHLGRPYTAVLGIGLVYGIVRGLADLGHAVGSSAGVLKIAILVLFQLALLINQIAQVHEHRQERRRVRDAGR